MEIKVKDFIRKNGKIGRVIDIWTNTVNTLKYWIDWGNGKISAISQIKNVKSSKNILDLLEKEDLVKVQYPSGVIDIIYIYNNQKLNKFKSEIEQGLKILEILTREKFIENGYEVN